MAEIQVVAIQNIDDQSETKQETEVKASIANSSLFEKAETAEIQEVAIQIDGQLKTATETNQVPKEELDIYMKKKLSKLPGEPFSDRIVTIHRIPCCSHETGKELCEPKIVAIGPYHHGKESLQTMEEHKWYTLRNFLARNTDFGIEEYLEAMRCIEEAARNCYSEPLNIGSEDFVMMLLLDGCFILEWFFQIKSCTIDALFSSGWAAIKIFTDICLLENQVPFFVLHKLLTIRCQGVRGRPNCEDHCPLLQLFCPVLTDCFEFTPFSPPQISCGNIHHLLHLCYLGVAPDSNPQTQRRPKNSVADTVRKFYHLPSYICSKIYSKPGKAESSEQTDLAPKEWTIPSISELHGAGVKFERKENPANIFDISFRNGTIEMPFLQIQDYTVTILWNMVALEQSHIFDFQLNLSSYLALMDTLINTDKDVAILERSAIFENVLQNAEEAATFFNQFDKIFGLNYRDHYFKGLFEDVREYSGSTWHRHRARLMQDYFGNPWSIISLVAAGILLILTFIQTYYSAAK